MVTIIQIITVQWSHKLSPWIWCWRNRCAEENLYPMKKKRRTFDFSTGENESLARFFFSAGISEISAEIGYTATHREKLIPAKKIRLHLNITYCIEWNRQRMLQLSKNQVWRGGLVLSKLRGFLGTNSVKIMTITHPNFAFMELLASISYVVLRVLLFCKRTNHLEYIY
jgi:hypothetical protein